MENDSLHCFLTFICVHTHIHLHRPAYPLTYMHMPHLKNIKYIGKTSGRHLQQGKEHL